MLLNILFILIGFVLLMKGGDFLIDGAVAIAQRAKLSNMVIGLTVVGFGTSMPELLVSTQPPGNLTVQANSPSQLQRMDKVYPSN